MKMPRYPFRASLLLLAVVAAPGTRLFAANEPVIVQAESGTVGAGFSTLTDAGVTYVTIQTTGAGQNPGTAARVISYSVTFPAAGAYNLFARLRVGADTFNDDSFFYGNGFGAKTVNDDAAWITANGLSPVGFSASADIVTGGGTVSTGVWKWIRLSDFDGGEPGVSFVVTAGNLTQTFQIGAREDGLDIDRLAFGVAGVDYTVDNLNNGTAPTVTPPPPVGQPLATGKLKFLGGVYSASQAPNLASYWNQVTPENAGKWGSVEATRDVMNWTELDAAYALAKANGFPFRFHILVWGSQQPNWMQSLSSAEQLVEIQQWFSAVAARYPAIDYLEVVNEPIHQPPSSATGGGNYLAALGGTGTTGWDWVRTAFRMARQTFPNTKLMLNEYSVENDATSMATYAAIVEILKAENLIDLVGIQGHAFSTTVSAGTLTTNLNTLAAKGLPIIITELDIDGLDDAVQLASYQRVFPAFWTHPSIVGITTWGYRSGLWRNAQGAYLIAPGDGSERPALTWLRGYVANANPNMIAQITSHPGAASKLPGENATFTAAAVGNPVPGFQWQRSTDGGNTWANLANDATFSGVTSATLNATAVTSTLNGSRFRAVVSNGIGSPTNTRAAVLTVPPTISTHPANAAITAGGPTTLSVVASGAGTLTYQWRLNGVDIAGATSASYVLPSVQAFHAGSYTVIVTDGALSTTSNAGTLTVNAAPTSTARLLNLSTRALCLTDSDALIPGFVLSGPGTKRLLIRGVGPTLDLLGVAGTLTDPQMTLMKEAASQATNDDWGTNANKAQIITTSNAVLAFPLVDGSKDAVLLVDLTAGNHTVPTTGVARGTGVAIVELYDADSSGSTASLINISNRGFVGIGDNIMISGFVLSSEGSRTFLIRVTGPALDQFGVPNTLVDPVLTVFSGNTPILSNDDWSSGVGAATTETVSAQVFAFPLTAGSKDASFVVTLPPGAYTVQATGKNATTGTALIEVYLVP